MQTHTAVAIRLFHTDLSILFPKKISKKKNIKKKMREIQESSQNQKSDNINKLLFACFPHRHSERIEHEIK